jgi:heptosyltransferase-1
MTSRAPTLEPRPPSSGLLIVRLSALGDVIHAMPAVALLRGALAGLPIGWAVESPYRELVEIVGRVTAIPASLKRWSRTPVSSRRDIASFFGRIRGYDTSVDFQGLIKSGAIARASGATLRYSFDRTAIREKLALLFVNRPVAVDRTRHVVDWNIELARAIAPHAAVPSVDFAPFADDPAGKLADLRDCVVLLPGAGGAAKLWPADRFGRIAKALRDRSVVLWGPGEEGLAYSVGGRIAPPTNLRELAYALQNAAVVVGGDTGPLHLAAALGTKVIGLYGPTDPSRNGPYGQLQNCIVAGSKSMDSISVEDVLGMIERILAR